MSLRKLFVDNFYQRKSFLDPTKNYSKLPQKLIKENAQKTIINVGAGEENLGSNVITLDRYSKAHITGDAMSLPVKTNSVDLALSIAVLEHLPEPHQAIQELFRIIKPKGKIYIEIPFLQPFHSSPHDYFRATLKGLQHWCRDFEELDSGVCVGPGSAIAWIEIEYLRLWFGKIPILGLLVEITFRLWALPLKYLDRFIIHSSDSHVTASAIYFLGRKPIR